MQGGFCAFLPSFISVARNKYLLESSAGCPDTQRRTPRSIDVKKKVERERKSDAGNQNDDDRPPTLSGSAFGGESGTLFLLDCESSNSTKKAMRANDNETRVETTGNRAMRSWTAAQNHRLRNSGFFFVPIIIRLVLAHLPTFVRFRTKNVECNRFLCSTQTSASWLAIFASSSLAHNCRSTRLSVSYPNYTAANPHCFSAGNCLFRLY